MFHFFLEIFEPSVSVFISATVILIDIVNNRKICFFFLVPLLFLYYMSCTKYKIVLVCNIILLVLIPYIGF